MQIIAGELKGRVLSYPKRRLRPTTDKIRGAIFNMINANFPKLLNQTLVLDIFAGAGAIGIEAISRGAKKVTFIENDPITLQYLNKNLCGLKVKTQIMALDAQIAIDKIKNEKFDIIFLDPPYDMGLIEPVIIKIAKYKMLNKDGIIVIEHHKKEQFLIPDNLTLFKRKDYNDTVISILILKETE